MGQLREFVVVMIVIILCVIAVAPDFWDWGDVFTGNFTVRHLLLAVTILAVVLGACVAFSPRVMRP